MKVFGLWERLTRLKFFDGKEVTVEPATQTVEDKVITIPDVSPATTQQIVLTEQTQTLKGKTISGADNTLQAIPGASLNNDSVTASKLDPTTVAGFGLVMTDTGAGVDRLDVNPDNSTLEISADQVRIKDAGVIATKLATDSVETAKIKDGAVTKAKLDASVAGTGLELDVDNSIKVKPDNSTLELDVAGDVVRVKDDGIVAAKIAAQAVTNAKIETAVGATGTGITLDKLRIEAGAAGTNDNRAKILKRDSTTGAVISGNTVPDSGTILTDSTPNSAVKLKTFDGLVTDVVESPLTNVSPGTNEVSATNRTGLIILTASVAGSYVVNQINAQNADGQHLVILNRSGGSVLIDNETGSNAARQIVTGTGGPINLADKAALFLVYRVGTSPAVNKWTVVGGTGGGAGGTVTQVTTPTAHGFTNADKGKALYLEGAVYTAAKADAANTAEVIGILANVIDSDTFELATGGAIDFISGDDFEGGSVPGKGVTVFLSPLTAGKMTSTEPSVVGQVSKPMGIIFDTNKMFFYNMRGSVVGAANARTKIYLDNATTTTIQNVTGYEAGELAGWVYLDGTTDYRFYVQAQFALNAGGTDWNLSYQTTGDTPPAGFSITATTVAGGNLIQVTTPSGGFQKATSFIQFALNAPAVGATLPLQIDSANVSFGTIQAKDATGISVKNAAGTTTNLFVSDAGNVGIGTSSPNSTLSIRKDTSDAVLRVRGTNSTARLSRIQFEDYTGALADGLIDFKVNTAGVASSAVLQLGVNSPAMTLDASGNITLGTASDGTTATHRINGNIINFSRYADTRTNGALAVTGAFNSQSSPIRLQSYGDNSSIELKAGESANTFSYISIVGNWNGSSNTGGKIDAVAGTGGARLSAGSTSWTAISDENKKEIIEPISNAVDKVLTLRAVIGRYKTDEEEKRRSFLIAQDVQAVLPEAVEVMDEEDGTLGLRYTETIPLLVAAIKEQQALIQSLQAESSALRAESEKLEARLAALESK